MAALSLSAGQSAAGRGQKSGSVLAIALLYMVCILCISGTEALTLHGRDHDSHGTIRDVPTRVQIRDELANGVELRVLPIGEYVIVSSNLLVFHFLSEAVTDYH